MPIGATIGAATIGAGASVYAGSQAAGAAKSAANAQQQANAQALAEQQREFNVNQTNLQPFLQAGQAAVGGQRDLLGLGGGTPDYASYVRNNPDLLAAYQAQAGGSGWAPNGPAGMSMEDFGKNYFQAYGQNGGQAYGSPNTPSAADAQQAAITGLQNSPLYESLFRNGENTILANGSATGGLRGGNMQHSLANFGADTLSTVIQNQLANLGGLSGQGANTGGALGSLGQSNANAQSQLYGANGAAAAGGILGSAGAMGGGISNAFAQIGSGLGGAYANGLGKGLFTSPVATQSPNIVSSSFNPAMVNQQFVSQPSPVFV